MYVCMYVCTCMSVYVHVCMYVRMYVCMYVCMACEGTYMYMYLRFLHCYELNDVKGNVSGCRAILSSEFVVLTCFFTIHLHLGTQA